VVLLIQNVCRHDPLEDSHRLWRPPIEHSGGDLAGQTIDRGIEPHSFEGRLLIIGGGHEKALSRGDQRGQAKTTPEFEQGEAVPNRVGQILSQHEGRLPHVGPVRNPFVGLECRHVDEGVDIRRVPDMQRAAR
jgi:hypothetical protein